MINSRSQITWSRANPLPTSETHNPSPPRGRKDGDRSESACFEGMRTMKTDRTCKNLSFWLVFNQRGFGNHVKSLSSSSNKAVVVKCKKLQIPTLCTPLLKRR